MADRTTAESRNGRAARAAPPPGSEGLHLAIDTAGLRPLIAAVVAEVLGQLDGDQARLPDRMAFGEAEAARLLSLHAHQLRDERLRGRIAASVGPGRKILYSREDLLNYLSGRRWEEGRG